MQVDVTVEELELILIALKEHVKGRREAGLSSTEAEGLIARLEVVERENRGSSRPVV